ncbi:hypothetical protein N7925_20905 [Streptomyces sp. CA-278952]|uniref:hypothetical protein n=1 Tax=unclassified Streptomyces TaxID=2593676 RepID=UPI002241F81A|nr:MULTISPECIES: hypothetical protein [unclassified Streptomyces]UZI30613.1 hypothetical protein OH133_22290 [Streptomyces sp. VB1]WDG30611.1 hypothetical protein N7925_20905 [Streptomyces sp. CA-278952]
MRRNVLWHVGGIALLTTLLLGATGCGSPEAFKVSEACGTKVDPDLIGRLLPRGEELKTKDTFSEPKQPRCEFEVDGKEQVGLRGDVVEPFVKPLEVKESVMLRLGDPAPADIGDGATIADHGGMALRACTYQGEKMQFVLAIDGVENPEETTERRRLLEEFLRSQLPVAMEAEGCRP